MKERAPQNGCRLIIVTIVGKTIAKEKSHFIIQLYNRTGTMSRKAYS